MTLIVLVFPNTYNAKIYNDNVTLSGTDSHKCQEFW